MSQIYSEVLPWSQTRGPSALVSSITGAGLDSTVPRGRVGSATTPEMVLFHLPSQNHPTHDPLPRSVTRNARP